MKTNYLTPGRKARLARRAFARISPAQIARPMLPPMKTTPNSLTPAQRLTASPLQLLRHHVTGAIERGEATPIVAVEPLQNKMTIYTPVVITPHHSGFGMFESGEVQAGPDNSYAFDSDLLQVAGEKSDSVMPIDEAIADADFIALGVEDIRGKIYNHPDQVFARIHRGELSYFGIVASEVSEDFFA